MQEYTVVTVHLSGRVVSNTTLSLTLLGFRMNFLLKAVRLYIIALPSVAMLTLGSHKNQTLPYVSPNLSHQHFLPPNLFHYELGNINSDCCCLQKQLEMIKTDILYYLQIAMNTSFHNLNEEEGKKTPYNTGCFHLGFGQASSRIQ